VLLREIQEDSDRADQAHSRAALTVSVPVPPDAGAGELLPVTEIPHLVSEGPATLTSAELPHPVTVASKPRQPARIGPTRAARVAHIRTELRRREDAIRGTTEVTVRRARVVARFGACRIPSLRV